jgi:hypothetical protein
MAYVYTEVEFDDIKQRYANGETLELIQSVHPSKSVASIRMKLVKAGLYTAVARKQVSSKPITSLIAVATPKPTTKAGIKLAYKTAHDAVGFAPF